MYPYQAPSQWDDCFGYNARWGYVKDATGLYYCQNRYYDPANGRWLTRDPIGYAGGVNLYGYCGGGPVGAVDPEGLFELFGFDFTLEGVGHGVATGLAGLAKTFTFGYYDGGSYQDEPGFEFSAGAGVVARECLMVAATAGVTQALAAARAARVAAPVT